MGLEYDPQLPVRIIQRCRQRGADFLRMMGIIIDNGDASQFSLLLKAAVCTREFPQSLLYHLQRYPQFHTYSNGRQGEMCIRDSPEGTALLVIENIVYDQYDVPIELSIESISGETHQFSFDVFSNS